MMRNVFFRCAVVLAVCCTIAVGGQRQYDFQREVLDNGLTVISLEDHSCPIVAVQVWYHVGSKDEDPERQGFAHMFEHMMFRGTDSIGPEEHFDYIRRSGGDCNAGTSFDFTSYVNELPSNQLELAMWLEADRMAFLKIDEEGFHTERKVVEEERRTRSLDTPYGMVLEHLLAGLFKEHPYRWSPIGNIPHLRKTTIDELAGFWDRFYVPSNATLVVVGDVTHEEVHSMAEKHFGWIPKMTRPPLISIKESMATDLKKLTIEEKKGPVPLVGLIYRGVPEGHSDGLPLEMLMAALGQGESSRIYKDLVKDKKLAQVAMGGAGSLEDAGFVGTGAMLMPWGNKQKVVDAMREHVKRAVEEGVTQSELDKVKNQYLRDEVTQSLTVASKASLLGQYQTIEGDAEKANLRLDDIRSVTVEDLQRVAAKYLVKDHETLVVVEPKMSGMLGGLLGGSGDDVDEGAPPPEKPSTNRVAKRGGPRADLKRPTDLTAKPPMADLLDKVPVAVYHDTVLGNGLKIVVIENHEVPFVTLTLGSLHGAWTESKTGSASMASSMITQGTAKHTAAELAEKLDFNAISIGGGASMDVASVNASCVTGKFDLAVELLAEVVLTPTFPKEEFDIQRQQILAGLMIQASTPQYLADRELRHRVFGEHPYSRTSTGEPSDIQALSADDLREWWSTFVRPDAAVLYVAGDVTPDDVFSVVKKHFGSWQVTGPKPAVKIGSIPAPEKTHIYLVDKPGSVQSQIRVGQLGITRKSKEYFTSRLLSQIFGGSFNSRLNEAVRVERGLTYGARGGFGARRFAGTFNISTNTKTPMTAEALQVILDEIDRIRESVVEPEELKIAQSYTVGSFPGSRETPQAVVGDLWLIEYADLPGDYLARYLDGIKKTTGDDILRVAKGLIDVDTLTIVVVGEADKIKADLEKIAPVTVVTALGMTSTTDSGSPVSEEEKSQTSPSS